MLSVKVRSYLCHGLAATPAVLERLLANATEAEIDARPDPERFTLREAVAHMADWEGVWLGRVQATATEIDPFLPGYDEGQWAIDHDYTHTDLAEQLARFRAGRVELVAYLRALDAEAWRRTARHAEWGAVTLLDMAALILGHDGYHLEQVVAFRAV